MDDDNPSLKHVEQIKIASLRARDIIQQMLNFSRKTDQVRKPINIAHVIKDSLRFLRASIPKSIDIRENVPDVAGIIFADATQMHQVMLNLCSNAADAMQDDGGTLNVELITTYFDMDQALAYQGLNPGPYIRLTVSDTGTGIAPEVHERIFEPFFTTKEQGKGTGMGLSMVDAIVKNHGGHIRVESQVGKGTAFEILLPKVEMSEDVAALTDMTLPNGNSEKVLLIDDEDMILDIGTEMLASLGYQVTVQNDAAAAVEMFSNAPEKFDVIITDLSMPHMTGYEVAKKILNLREDIPVILCTGYGEAITTDRLEAAGIRELLFKPFILREIAQVIRNTLDTPWSKTSKTITYSGLKQESKKNKNN
jgi:CheY-like chemotaxis protein